MHPKLVKGNIFFNHGCPEKAVVALDAVRIVRDVARDPDYMHPFYSGFKDSVRIQRKGHFGRRDNTIFKIRRSGVGHNERGDLLRVEPGPLFGHERTQTEILDGL